MIATSRSEYETDCFYDVCVQVSHPARDLDYLTTEFGLKPSRTWRVGDKRRGPNGAPLPAVRSKSYWSVSERILGQRHFMNGVFDQIEAMFEPREAFLK